MTHLTAELIQHTELFSNIKFMTVQLPPVGRELRLLLLLLLL